MFKAIHKESGRLVAIKKFKESEDDEHVWAGSKNYARRFVKLHSEKSEC